MRGEHEVDSLRPARPRGWSLRAQIVVALIVVLGGGWMLVGLAADRLVISALPPERAHALSRLLIGYAGLSTSAMLLLSYALLTRLVVQPLDALQAAAERLAKGGAVRAVPQGATEAQALALAFNGMAKDLEAERAALNARVEELTRTTAELREAHDSLVRSERLASVGRLAAGVAHEIGNPLAAIAGLVELVRAGGLTPAEADDFLGRIQSETDRIHRILRELLDYARAGSDANRDASASVADGARSALRLLEPQKELKGIELVTEIPSDLPPVVIDSDALTQVLINLLLNAADAIERPGTIRIAASRAGSTVCISVSDSGGGIAPEIRDRLFEPFVSTKARGRGSGLGLAVSRALVERFGGTLDIGCTGPEGTRFEIKLSTS